MSRCFSEVTEFANSIQQGVRAIEKLHYVFYVVAIQADWTERAITFPCKKWIRSPYRGLLSSNSKVHLTLQCRSIFSTRDINGNTPIRLPKNIDLGKSKTGIRSRHFPVILSAIVIGLLREAIFACLKLGREDRDWTLTFENEVYGWRLPRYPKCEPHGSLPLYIVHDLLNS